MTNERVVLPREVAGTLDLIREFRGAPYIVEKHARNPFAWREAWQSLNGLALDTLIRALYYGYRVERTPLERACDFLRDNCAGEAYSYGVGRYHGALEMAEILSAKYPELSGVLAEVDAE